MGLTVVYPTTQDEVESNADLVVIHGLNGTDIGSFTDTDTKFYWPQGISYDFPKCRVMTFSYNADVVFTNSTADIIDHARDLLAKLLDSRKNAETREGRPIIFIAHSLGGIVVKQALIQSKLETRFSTIAAATTGLVFFGTPHQGSSSAVYGKLLADIASAMTNKPSSKLIKALKSKSDALLKISSEFRHQLLEYSIVSFYETRPYLFKGLVVEKHSALMNAPEEDQVPVNRHHRNMCKFTNRDDETYRMLCTRIQNILGTGKPYSRVAPNLKNKYYLVSQSVSAQFTGRRDLSTKLDEAMFLNLNCNTQRRYVLYGLGGSGKTQVALKFAQKNCGRFWGVFWIDCSTSESIEQGYLAIAKACGIAEDASSTRLWLANSSENWLLLFDNADDPDVNLQSYFPAGPRGSIIITTRNPNCAVHATVGSHELGSMDEGDAAKLLLKFVVPGALKEGDMENAREIVSKLSCLALAVSQAGAAIRQGLCNMRDFCGVYEQRRKDLMARVPQQASEDYKYTIYTTWEISIGMIESQDTEVSRHALDLLCVFSYLHFDGITEDIFKRAYHQTARRRVPTLEKACWLYDNMLARWDPFLIREPLQLLSSFSLIQRGLNGKQYSMHPLVHSWVRDRMDILDQAEWPYVSALILGLSCPWGDNTECFIFQKFLLPHLINCEKYFIIENELRGENMDSGWLDICVSFIRIYYSAGQFQAGFHLGRIITEAGKRVLGAEHPDTLVSMCNLALNLNKLGRYREAASLIEGVIQAQKKVLGAEHPNTLISIGNLVRSLNGLGRYQEAVSLIEEVIQAQKKVLGAEHPHRLISIGSLVRSLNGLGRYQEAVSLIEEVIQVQKKVLGAEHPDRLISMRLLAAVINRLGRCQEATTLIEEVMQVQKKVLGAEHPDTLISMGSLADGLNRLGRYQKAVSLIEEVIYVQKKVLGAEHPSLLSSMSCLAHNHWCLGRHKDALQLSNEILEKSHKVLGADHPNTLYLVSNLSQRHYMLGSLNEAIKFGKQALEDQTRILGADHPSTLTTASWLEIYQSKEPRNRFNLRSLVGRFRNLA